ncbi:MAG: ParB/RepB/Spo0J family partition protein [Deltaproteobacteria bacterium]|nr:ParB/RepB/Spo0J family partition protein [Deltaproteobacteria bacterium]
MSKSKSKPAFPNRIVGSGEEDPEQILANPLNWRIHPEFQQDALKGLLSEVGWVQQVVVNKRTGHLVDGHLRVMLALREHISAVPVVYVDLSEAEEKKILATLDPIAALAGSDAANLHALLEDIETGDAAVMQLLEDTAEKAGLHRTGSGSAEIPLETDGASVGAHGECLLKWEVNKKLRAIPLTEEELALLEAALKAHVETAGVQFGFVLGLLGN